MKSLTLQSGDHEPQQGRQTLNSQAILSDPDLGLGLSSFPIWSTQAVTDIFSQSGLHVGPDGALIEVLTQVADHRQLLSHGVEAAVVVEGITGAVAVADVVVVIGVVAVAGEVAVVPVVAVVVVVETALVSVVTVGPEIENIFKYFATRISCK